MRSKKERAITEGGYEEVYPSVIDEFRSSKNPYKIAVEAGLSKKQWECISHYIFVNTNFSSIRETTGMNRPNIYATLSLGFARLQRRRLLLERGEDV